MAHASETRQRLPSGFLQQGPAPIPMHPTLAAIATAAGVGGLYVQRTRLRTAQSIADMDAARTLAASGLEHALARIDAAPTWRTSIGAGSWLDAVDLGPGTLSVSVADPIDADIADAPTDPIRITAAAAVGDARQRLSADVEFTSAPYTVLQCAAYGGANVYIGSTTLTADSPVSSGAGMTALAATVQAPVEAVGLVSGLIYYQSQQSGATARTVPASADLLSTWSGLGTSISYASLSGGILERRLLKPGAGTATTSFDPSVWVINCAGGALTIRDLRIYGTLVVLNASTVTVSSSVRIDPVNAGWPSLIVQGQLRLGISTAVLRESTVAANLNPAGAPWQGTTDTDMADSYASGITGIVLATGEVQVNQALTLTGTLISLGNQLTVSNTLTITRDVASQASPPPGFYTLTPTLSAEGVERIAN